MRDWRPMTWIILVVNVLFLIWIVVGLSGASENCAGLTGDELELCEGATAVGATIGAGLILFLWVMVDVILGVIWLVTRSSARQCPACGRKVKKGLTQCGNCGYDFRQAGAPAGQGAPAPPPPATQQWPAGWYEDSTDPSVERWWDGSSWSDNTRPRQPAQP